MITAEGELADNTNISPGEPAQGAPGEYTSIGVIRIRDLENRRLVVQDTRSDREFVVDEADTWDYDTVEYADLDT